MPGRHRCNENPDEQEFVAEENTHFDGYDKTTRKVSADDKTVTTSNVSPTSEEDVGEQGKTRMRELTFDPSPPLKEGEEVHLVAANDQAE